MISENAATFVSVGAMDNVDFERPPIVALAALVAYLAVMVAIATATFARRDVIAA